MQSNKVVVWNFWQAMNTGSETEMVALVRQHMHADVDWNGSHPLNNLRGTDALMAQYYLPMRRAFPNLRREPQIFLSGRFNDKDWVSSTGYFTGTFAADWLGLPATKQNQHLRYGEFCALREGKIVEVYLILDVIELLIDCGHTVLPTSLGDEGLRPPPKHNNGLLLAVQDEAQSTQSLQLVENMIFNGLSKFDGKEQGTLKLTDFWSADMHWYGPGGIGSAFSMAQYYEVHSKPFLHGFPDRKGGNHKARFAEGQYVASTGWPSIHATHTGEYLGCAATNKPITMRVMDWWRRDDNLLVQNWVFIDIPELFLQFGVDLLSRVNG